MLWFVGLGLTGDLPAGAEDVLEAADHVYLERFTSPVSDALAEAVRGATRGRFVAAKRWQVEDGAEILGNAREGTVALVSYGDPMIATTHIELRTRAASGGIATGVVHGASSLTAMVGECGLHYYKVGRVTTIMDDVKAQTTPYYIIYGNLIGGNHTVLLLEYGQDGGFFLEPAAAMALLLGEEAGQRRGVIGPETFAIVVSRAGTSDQRIAAGRFSSLMGRDFGEPPHSVIIPGMMHFTESDALKALADCMDEPSDNTQVKISRQMLEKYAPMIREAIRDAGERYAGTEGTDAVLENAELYVQDAIRFMEQDMDELAVLSIGYADGLVDSLRMAAGDELHQGKP